MDQQVQPSPSQPNASPAPFFAAVAAVLVLFGSAVAYVVHQHGVAKNLAAQNEQIQATLKTTQSELDALTTKLNALAAPPTQATPQLQSAKAAVHHRHLAKDDPRWKQVQSRIDEQDQQIASTQQDLQNARTELSGSIARTHDELVVLEKRGERSYFEFDLQKAKQFQPEGPISVRLKKANTKHEYADLELLVDDMKLQKKHVNVYEPVVFYAGDNGQAVELVINSVTKDHIHGYVSQPKYKSSELSAMAASSQNASTPAAYQNTTSRSRQKLEVPKN
jgi:transcriptional regulator with PAS, ATPase and Fis domain